MSVACQIVIFVANASEKIRSGKKGIFNLIRYTGR